jgi:3-deoxy-D-manno-octulosonic acid (KDO) 8-phosphate synthase
MSEDRLLSIIGYWKSAAYNLVNQLEYSKKAYEEECLRLQKKINQFEYENLLFKEIFSNTNKSFVSSKVSLSCDSFLPCLQLVKDEIECPRIIEDIRINIEHIGGLINRMNEECKDELRVD